MEYWPTIRRILVSMIVLWMILFITPFSIGEEKIQNKTGNILVIYTGSIYTPAISLFSEGFIATLEDYGYQATQIHNETIDKHLNLDDDYFDVFYEYLDKKYRNTELDAIVTVGDMATQFICNEGLNYRKDVPVIASTIGQLEFDFNSNGRKIVILGGGYDIEGTLDQAFLLFPKTNTVAVVEGIIHTEQKENNRIENYINTHQKNTKLIYIQNDSKESMLQEVSNLPDFTIIMYITFFRDGKMNNYVPKAVLREIAEDTNAPIFSFLDTMLDTGCIGGSMFSLEHEGKRAAIQTNQVVNNPESWEGAKRIPPAFIPIYDDRVLNKYHIDGEILPQNADIRYALQSTFQRYALYLYCFGAILLIFIVLTGLLIGINRKKTIAQIKLSLVNEKLEQYNSNLAAEIEERTRAEQESLYLSYHDALTGLFNRRYYELMLERMDQNENLPLSIVVGDVNGLKLINDAFGHVQGDQVLILAARAIDSQIRENDVAARWGGDEFVILLPNTKMDEAEQIANKIQNEYKTVFLDKVQISISFGVATKYKDDDDIMAVLKIAENTMYQNKNAETEGIRKSTVNTIINAYHAKDELEELHARRVSDMCYDMGIHFGMSDKESNRLKVLGLIHDIGKIAIQDDIMKKEGIYTSQERIEMERHAEIGYRILIASREMSDMAEWVWCHHERWDGSGYPQGLEGEKIPLQARMLAVADSFDAMTSWRPYKAPLSIEDAFDEMENNAGKQFDPVVVKLFLEKIAPSLINKYQTDLSGEDDRFIK